MPIIVTCPNCRDSLEIPNEFVGGDVRCGSCQEIFTAQPSTRGDGPPPLPREERRPKRRIHDGNEGSRNKRKTVSRADDGYGEVEFDPDRKRKQGVGLALWLLFGVFGLMSCGCCGVFGWLVYDTMDPKYKPFNAPDGKFVAQFPAEVRTTTRPTGRAVGENAPAWEAERGFVQETYFVYQVDLKPEDKRDPAKTANKLCDGLISANSGTTVTRLNHGHQGYESIDLVMRLAGRRYMKARVIVAEDRGYVLGVAVNQEPSGMIWLDHFFDGFEIKAGEKKDAPPAPKPPAKKQDDDD